MFIDFPQNGDEDVSRRLAFIISLTAISASIVVVRLQLKWKTIRNLGPEDVSCIVALVRHQHKRNIMKRLLTT